MSLYNPEGVPPIVTDGFARVERRLPFPGELTVRTGQRVEPETVVAQALVPQRPAVINVSEQLGIPPVRAARLVRPKHEQLVPRGADLARAGGRRCRAPIAGKVATIDEATGYVTIEPDPLPYALRAGIRGIITEEIPYQGVVIETPAAQVYGVVGVGDERISVLALLLTDPDRPVEPADLDVRLTGTILVCNGGGITAAALRKAIELEIRGVVVGSIRENELRDFLGLGTYDAWYTGKRGWQVPTAAVRDPGITLVVTEGFGTVPMATPFFDLLSQKDREEAFIEGHTTLRSPHQRPRVVMPLARGGGGNTPPPQLEPGVSVRLLAHAYRGMLGTVQAVSLLPRRLAPGIRTPAVQVVLPDAGTVWVPITTVEVVES